MRLATAAGALLQITPSERQALQMLADEKGATDIASCLGIHLSEVEARLAALFAAMGTSTRTEAIAAAARRGLLK
ncbi:MAG TPA: LuxR C-terminal-related transcriptional regulator [Vicinamibacterales bacterium]|nr:LuxR C-terminal-related transcriptional regulator [Vicinamibacterales bacterium]